jgi:hypothetical protein
MIVYGIREEGKNKKTAAAAAASPLVETSSRNGIMTKIVGESCGER